MSISRRDLDHVFQCLRSGLVPERGLEAFAVGIDRKRAEMRRMLALAEDGEGVFKFLRGGYGCGKTFMARLTMRDAIENGFAVSFVVVSDNDLHFHRFDELYRKVVESLATLNCPRGALADVIDRWIANVEDALMAAGADEDADDFDAKVRARMAEQIETATRGQAPHDFARVLHAVFDLKQQGRLGDAAALISWLSGSSNVAAGAKKAAGVKGDIGSADAMAYLQGILAVVKAAGYKGLVVVIDEAETILRMRRDVRGKSLNGIRQIIDDAQHFPGLLWMFTGTPDFFDSRRGVRGLEPLDQRIEFTQQGKFASPRQAQLELRRFDKQRLRDVALKLRDLFPATDRGGLDARVTEDFIQRLVDKVSEGLGGKVGIVPRQFLRQFVEVLDIADMHDEFDPASELGFAPKALTEDEIRAAEGRDAFDREADDERGYEPRPVEW